MIDKYGVDESFLKTLNLLYVEDDEVMRLSVQKRFGGKFSKFIAVSDAESGLEEFAREHYDLVMTDYFLPRMSGLAFTREIRAIKSNVPVIMVTAHTDMEFLVAAINMGVTQFVAKPVQFKVLNNAIMNAVERVVIDNLRSKAKEQEFELLQYKETREAFHNDFARRKEQHLLRDDLRMRYFSPGGRDFNEEGWNFNFLYEAKEPVSGDMYSCRLLSDDRVALIIVDAMGKGVSAAITSAMVVFLFNYLIDVLKGHDVDLQQILGRSLHFIKSNLLDDEILCCTLAIFDFKDETMTYAAFSMPKIYFETSDCTVTAVPCNNMPIMKFSEDFNIDTLDLKDVVKILIYSDGLNESITKEGPLYGEFIEDDLRRSPFISILENRMRRRVAEFEDDMSVFFLRRTFWRTSCRREKEVETSFAGLEELTNFIIESLYDLDMNNAARECFCAAFSEILMNAYEHGNLGIGYDLKHRYIMENIYEEKLMEAERSCDKKILARFICCKCCGNEYVVVSVRDEGEGYPSDIFRYALSSTMKFNGRGIKMLERYTDDFFFSEDRREIFIVKLFGDNAI